MTCVTSYAQVPLTVSKADQALISAKPTQRVESDLTAAHEALKITPAQEQAWVAYADMRRADAREAEKTMANMQKLQATPGQSLVDALQLQRDRLTQAESRLDALINGTKALYAVLTPEQRTAADDVLAPHRPVPVAMTTPAAVPPSAPTKKK